MVNRIRTVVCSGILALLGISSALAEEPGKPYLALGDSIPFGYNPTIPLPTVPPAPPGFLSNYHGYPQFVAASRGWSLSNAACPGETSGSFINVAAPDNGCREWREFLPLFVNYLSPLQSQLDYAIAYLQANPKTQLVTITIGGDDLLLLEEACATQLNPASCENSGLGTILTAYAENLTAIYTGLRVAGHYQGRIVAMNYFSPDYTNALETAAVRELNTVLFGVTAAFGGSVADVFSVFELASLTGHGLPCRTPIPLAFPSTTPGTCDVHPTVAGQELIRDLVLLSDIVIP